MGTRRKLSWVKDLPGWPVRSVTDSILLYPGVWWIVVSNRHPYRRTFTDEAEAQRYAAERGSEWIATFGPVDTSRVQVNPGLLVSVDWTTQCPATYTTQCVLCDRKIQGGQHWIVNVRANPRGRNSWAHVQCARRLAGEPA